MNLSMPISFIFLLFSKNCGFNFWQFSISLHSQHPLTFCPSQHFLISHTADLPPPSRQNLWHFKPTSLSIFPLATGLLANTCLPYSGLILIQKTTFQPPLKFSFCSTLDNTARNMQLNQFLTP